MTMLRYDEIPPERLPILDYTGRIGDEGHCGVLGVALAQWAARDDTRPEPEVRRAANTAMDAIDAMLAELHEAARVDAMLARCRGASR